MSKMKFKNGDLIAILVDGSDEFIQEIGTASNPFNLFPGNSSVSPAIEYWEATADTECDIDAAHYIRDNANVQYPKIVGGRPRNIVRR